MINVDVHYKWDLLMRSSIKLSKQCCAFESAASLSHNYESLFECCHLVIIINISCTLFALCWYLVGILQTAMYIGRFWTPEELSVCDNTSNKQLRSQIHLIYWEESHFLEQLLVLWQNQCRFDVIWCDRQLWMVWHLFCIMLKYHKCQFFAI